MNPDFPGIKEYYTGVNIFSGKRLSLSYEWYSFIPLFSTQTLTSIDSHAIISFNNVTYRLGSRVLLDAVNFDIHLGEFVYLVGKTGVGKSTIMRLVYADLKPNRGFIRVGDKQLGQLSFKDIPYLRRDMGIVFQDFQLLPDRTVYQNIQFALKATGWKDRRKIKQRIEEVLMKVGMTGKASAMPYQLSGGEQQRVSIARALINDPMILIADEPTGNLDPEASRHVMDVVRKINLGGTAVMMVTHEYDIIRQYPSRVLELAEGKLSDFQRGNDFLDAYGNIPSSI